MSLAAWAVVAILGIALMAMALGPHRVGDYFTETDFYGAYAEGARAIQQGRLDPSRYGVIGPGYELTLAVVGFAISDLFLAAEMISVFSAIAILVLWFLLLRARAGPRVALLATLFVATNAYFFRFGYAAATDLLAIALQAAALYLMLTRRGERAFLAAGAIAAAAFLTRYNAIYLLPAGWIALWAGGTQAVHRGRAVMLFTAGFLAPVLPWVLFSLGGGGAFSLQLHHNIAYDVFARAKGIAWDEYQRTMQPEFKSLWDVIARDPGAVVSRLVFNVGDHLRLDAQSLLGWPVAVSALLGLVLGWRDGTLKKLWPLLVAGVLAFGTLVPVFYAERYALALLPIYATLAAMAFGATVGRSAAVRTWLPVLGILPLTFAGVASFKHQAYALSQLPLEVILCAETLRSLKTDGDRVIARKAHIAYHGKVAPLPFPFAESLEDLAGYAHREGARWLYFSWPEAETRPRFWYLLDTAAVVPGLTVREFTRRHPAVLYEIGPEFGHRPDWLANDTVRVFHESYARLLVDARNPQLLYQHGLLARQLKRWDRARVAFQQRLRFEPNDLATMLLLGDVELRAGEFGSAARTYATAEQRHPGNVDARVGRGWAALMAGNAHEAAELWQPVIEMTRDRETLARMAELYTALGDRANAASARTTLARTMASR